ncbi:Spo0B domain-containing protein [Oceanobacillus saliphilus]|uniref:Spo0B domain-containing protein n=1 Tax=Oceanobacillus saliphilus TaxID=2925834 RepID=UPI00201E5B65|nr:Spo0B domain-containing protein [Oceanobacillus saliphilus]
MSVEIIRVLQQYRHDLMNRLQIVQGYMSMGKTEIAEKKLNEVLAYYNEERRLMGLNMPAFMLWILEFDSSFDNFRLKYTIHGEYKNVHISESILIERCQDIMADCSRELDLQVLYEVKLVLSKVANMSEIKVELFIHSDSDIDLQVKEHMIDRYVNKEIDIDKTANGIRFCFTVPCQ